MRILNKKLLDVKFLLAGQKNLKQGDIQKYCPDVEILNPDFHIARLNSDAKLNMELRFAVGKGYVPSTEQKFLKLQLGTIPIDSIYTPYC